MRLPLLALLACCCQLLPARADQPPPELYALTENLPPLSYQQDGDYKGFSNELC